MLAPARPDAARIASLDAVRGFAVCGILLMNIVAMGLPAFAYVNPTYAGMEGPLDLGVWAANYVLADGKMRALFTMMFGASMVLIAGRAAARPEGMGPAETHYRRVFWLFLFGMAHAWFIWFGDILTVYAVAGAILFPLWRWRKRALGAFAALMLVLQLGLNLGYHSEMKAERAAATAPGATEKAVETWQARVRTQAPDRALAARETQLYRGSYGDAFAARLPMTLFFQTMLHWLNAPEVFGFIALGMLLFRSGFFSGDWSKRAYGIAIALGYGVAVPLMVVLARAVIASGFDFVFMPLAESIGLVLRPFVALAHASVVILLVRAGALRPFMSRLEAAGRMAFSNYLGTSLVATTLFYGYGFGLFGSFSRAELYMVVLCIWALILLWSKPWLARFEYGPLEWAWRRLARGPVSIRRTEAIAS